MTAPTYAQLLEEALELGRADGAFAAALQIPRTTAPTGERCLGRTPADFARLLWDGRPGDPPTGLEVNAPLWYATGFAEGLTTVTARQVVRQRACHLRTRIRARAVPARRAR